MKRKVSFSLLMVMLLTLCFSVMSAFAAEGDYQLLTPEDKSAATTMFADLQKSGKSDGTTIKVVEKSNPPTGADGNMIKFSADTITFNKTAFEYATDSSRKKALGDFITALQDSQISKQTQQNIINNYSELSPDVSRMLIPLVMDSTHADLFGAMKVINPFLPFIRLVFGIGAFVIFIFLMASTIVDLTFIGLPMAREGLQNKGEQKGGKIPFVSSDAMSVVKETESALDSSGGYKNAYVIYFKRRVLTYIILSICVLYLVVGELGGVIAWLLGLASGTISQ